MDDVIEQLRAADEQTFPPRPFDLETSLRRARSRARRRRVGHAATGLATAAAVVVGVALWPADTDGIPEPAAPADPAGPAEPATPMDSTGPRFEPREHLSVLDTPRGSNDRLPDVLTQDPSFSDSQLVMSSVRFLAEHGEQRYWAAVNHGGWACLVMLVPQDKLNVPPERDWSWFVSCGGFVPRGLSASGGGERSRLVPDEYERSAEDRREWTFLTPNLAVAKD